MNSELSEINEIGIYYFELFLTALNETFFCFEAK